MPDREINLLCVCLAVSLLQESRSETHVCMQCETRTHNCSPHEARERERKTSRKWKKERLIGVGISIWRSTSQASKTRV